MKYSALIFLWSMSISNFAIANEKIPTLFFDLANEPTVYPYLDTNRLSLVDCAELVFDESHNAIDTCMSDRLVNTENQYILIVVRHSEESEPTISFTEKRRTTKIKQDFAQLINIYNKIVDSSTTGAAPPQLVTTEQLFKLRYQRSNIETSVGLSADDPSANVDLNFIAGPKEHLFLSADIFLTNADELKYDTGTEQLVERQRPSEFFASLNYQVGDVLNPKSWSYLDRVYGKLMIKIDSRPLDSYGVGVGYRFKKFTSIGFFFAYNRFLEDSLDNASVPADRDSYESEWRFGIGWNIDYALGWLQ